MASIRDIIQKVRETVFRYGMLNTGDRVVVAVSGGPDSMCLLDILVELSDELDLELVIAHFNHGLRGSEDEAETRLVGNFANSMGLPFETENGALLEKGAASIEEKARDARYLFLEEVRKSREADRIAVGHTLNDQAETVLMRLLRGSGPSGLAGIPPVRDGMIIRPLIELKREEIMSYITSRKLPYAFDSSNSDTKYLRNRVRLELLPLMLDYQPRLLEHLGRLSVILRDEDKFLESQAVKWIETESRQDTDRGISVPLSSFKELQSPLRNRVARQLLKITGENLLRIDHDHIQSVTGLARSMNPQAMINLPNGIKLKKVYERLEFSSGENKGPMEFRFEMKKPGSLYMEQIGRTIIVEEMKEVIDPPKGESPDHAYLDADRLDFPLTVRNFRPGDRFIPLGMKGRKKIKDFFIDLKIPSETRRLIPILTSRGEPAWICGYRIDDRFKITPKTKRAVKVTIV